MPNSGPGGRDDVGRDRGPLWRQVQLLENALQQERDDRQIAETDAAHAYARVVALERALGDKAVKEQDDA